MPRLPVITALGGINPAGRSSCHHGARRMLLDALPSDVQQRTLDSLAALGGERDGQRLLDGSLVRRLDNEFFDPERIPVSRAANGRDRLADWRRRSETTRAAIRDYDEATLRGEPRPVYHFGEGGALMATIFALSDPGIRIAGHDQTLRFDDDELLRDYLPGED